MARLEALARQGFRRYLTGPLDDFVELLAHEPTAVLEYDGRLVAAAQAGWRLPPMAWIRWVMVDSRVDAGVVLGPVIQQLHQLLPVRGIGALYVTLDEWTLSWLRPPLKALGYQQSMEVWSYDKHTMDVPSSGNQAITVRRARAEDLSAVLRLDAVCFPTPWGKGEEILGPAVMSAPYFAVAEFSGEIIGYSYVTVHGSGLHAHLVRIAVLPAYQGRAIGVRLLAEVVRFCRSRRIELLSLNTQDYNLGAQRLYEWFGFERTGETQTVLGLELDAAAQASGSRQAGG